MRLAASVFLAVTGACTALEDVPFRCERDADCADGYGCNAARTCEQACCARTPASPGSTSSEWAGSSSAAGSSSSSIAVPSSSSAQVSSLSSLSVAEAGSSSAGSSTSATSGPAPSSSADPGSSSAAAPGYDKVLASSSATATVDGFMSFDATQYVGTLPVVAATLVACDVTPDGQRPEAHLYKTAFALPVTSAPALGGQSVPVLLECTPPCQVSVALPAGVVEASGPTQFVLHTSGLSAERVWSLTGSECQDGAPLRLEISYCVNEL